MMNDRTATFALALQYLQSGAITVVDVGCGFSEFGELVQRKNPQAVVHLLDGNAETVETLKARGFNARVYRAPQAMPFADETVALLHCSHLVEHLMPNEVYGLLQDVARVISPGGYLVISTPTLWEGFYNDLSHIRPYLSTVFDKYLTCNEVGMSSTRKHLGQFDREEHQCRYQTSQAFSTLGLRGKSWPVDLGVLGLKYVGNALGIYRLSVTGYTTVYRRRLRAY